MVTGDTKLASWTACAPGTPKASLETVGAAPQSYIFSVDFSMSTLGGGNPDAAQMAEVKSSLATKFGVDPSLLYISVVSARRSLTGASTFRDWSEPQPVPQGLQQTSQRRGLYINAASGNGGNCVIDGDCIASPNYPSPYGADESCDIGVDATGVITTDAFNTGMGDYLSIDGTNYEGSSGPNGAVVTGPNANAISWYSDYSDGGETGWRVCWSTGESTELLGMLVFDHVCLRRWVAMQLPLR